MAEIRCRRVLATRPAPRNDRLCEDLSTAGWEPVALPLIEIQPIEETDTEAQVIRNHILDLDHYSVVIVVSPNAAKLSIDWIDRYWPQLPIGIHWFALGETSAHELDSIGISAIYPDAGSTSEDLLQHPLLQREQVDGKKVLIMRGEGGRATLGETLNTRGASVEYCQLYRRHCPPYSTAEIDKRVYASPLSGILITSGEALENLLMLAPALPDRHTPAVIVPSERIAINARQRGFHRVFVAPGADNQALIETLNAVDRQEPKA